MPETDITINRVAKTSRYQDHIVITLNHSGIAPETLKKVARKIDRSLMYELSDDYNFEAEDWSTQVIFTHHLTDPVAGA